MIKLPDGGRPYRTAGVPPLASRTQVMSSLAVATPRHYSRNVVRYSVAARAALLPGSATGRRRQGGPVATGKAQRRGRVLASKPQLPGYVHCGSGRLGPSAAPVSDHGYRLLLGKPGADGERLIEPGPAQPLTDLGHQFGFHLPQVRPGRQSEPAAQALGRAFQPRCPLLAAV
jgi:hypothetical protein